MMPISWPFSELSLMSARTAKYVEALIREGDNFDYDEWLKRVREQEAEAKQLSAESNVNLAAAANIGNQVKTSPVGRGTATPLMRNLHAPRAVRQSGQPMRGTTPAERLRRWLVKVHVAWRQFQGNRARDAVYDYLEAVFAIVMHYKVRRRTKRLLRAAFRFADLRFDKTADPFIAVIRCTCGGGTDNKLISKWARALRYATLRKPAEMRVNAFIKNVGGVNECAAGYAKLTRVSP
jgi:hypothetical protein